MFFEGRRGSLEELWKAFFSLLLLLVLATAFTIYVGKNAESDAFIREFYARDNALLVDSMRGGQGSAVIGYHIEGYEGDFDFLFEESVVRVVRQGGAPESGRAFPHNPSGEVDFEESVITASHGHSFLKEEDLLQVRESAGGEGEG